MPFVPQSSPIAPNVPSQMMAPNTQDQSLFEKSTNAVTYTAFEDLPNYEVGVDPMQVIKMITEALEDKTDWKKQFDSIDQLRILNKYYKNDINKLFMMFAPQILKMLEGERTNITKNCLLFVTEIFKNGKTVQIAKEIIEKVIPILMQKGICEKGFIKDAAKAALSEFTLNCLYDYSFIIICQLCNDKNSNICDLAIKILAKMIQAVDTNFVNLASSALQTLMKMLVFLLDGKRQTMKNYGLQICMYIYKIVGSENYFHLMNSVLLPKECELMIKTMEQKNSSPKPRESLHEVLQKKRMNENPTKKDFSLKIGNPFYCQPQSTFGQNIQNAMPVMPPMSQGMNYMPAPQNSFSQMGNPFAPPPPQTYSIQNSQNMMPEQNFFYSQQTAPTFFSQPNQGSFF